MTESASAKEKYPKMRTATLSHAHIGTIGVLGLLVAHLVETVFGNEKETA